MVWKIFRWFTRQGSPVSNDNNTLSSKEVKATKNLAPLVAPPPSPIESHPTSSEPHSVVTTGKHKKDVIPKRVREAVWKKYHNDSNTGICYACGITIQRYNRGWHCSHILSDVKGGEEIVENMRTCCPHCNLSMGSQNLYVYIKEKELTGPGRKNVEAYLQAHPDQINSKNDRPNRKPRAQRLKISVRNLLKK
jgi:hypothetical protein